jgi:HEPN domain-containing protein
MTERPEFEAVIRRWIEKAENDFKNAEHTLKMEPEICPFDTVCFHAQQTVEKYLKAVLVKEGVDFPKVHDIGELVERLPPALKAPLTIAEQELITTFAVAGRYPSEEESYSAKEASEAMKIARKFRDWSRIHLLPTP